MERLYSNIYYLCNPRDEDERKYVYEIYTVSRRGNKNIVYEGRAPTHTIASKRCKQKFARILKAIKEKDDE